MSVTILAVLFLILMLLVTYFGYRFVIRKDISSLQSRTGKCSVCRGSFPPDRLIERQSGDTRIYRFCPDCIAGLHEELRKRS